MSLVTLETPFVLKNGQVIKNRFMKSATSEQLADKKYNPTKGFALVYKSWVETGVGLIVTGNIMVDRSALGEPLNVVLDNESDLSKFKKWATVATKNHTQCWAQLNHPGKQSPRFLTNDTVAPSAIPLKMGTLSTAFAKPRALKTDEIWEIVNKFAQSAYLAKLVGFTGVQIHAAHGYLVSQFLSPTHNKRTDEWGGSTEKRMKFMLEVYKAIRAKVGADFTVAVKLNSSDFQKEGFSEQESIQVVQELTKLGIDHVEISGGSYESQAMTGAVKELQNESTKQREAYFLTYAQQLREVCDVALTVTGGFRSSQVMRAALTENYTDMIGIARPFLIIPDMIQQAIQDPNYVAKIDEPTTGSNFFDEVSMISISWYEEQIYRVSKGKRPDKNLNAWLSVARTYSRLGKKAFSKRRA